MPHDSNGRIFTQNGQGIDVRGDVAYVLGRSTGDVGQLCGDAVARRPHQYAGGKSERT